jgi:hypothetical protein
MDGDRSNYFAILILFEYNSLPGIISDFRRTYAHVHDRIKVPRKNTIVVSDIKREQKSVCIISDHDESAVQLIRDIKELGIHHPYTNKYDFQHILETTFRKISLVNNPRVFFYYSGHGQRNKTHSFDAYNFLLPDKEFLNSLEFSSMINILPQSSQLFITIDACHALGIFSLPYKCDDGKIEYDPFVKHVVPEIILAASCGEEEWSSATKTGSIFTDAVIRYLSGMYNNKDTREAINHIELMSKGKYKNRPGLYVSLPSVKRLWGWLFGFPEYPNINVRLTDKFVFIRGTTIYRKIKI